MIQSDTAIKIAFAFTLLLESKTFIESIKCLAIFLQGLVGPPYIQKYSWVLTTNLFTCHHPLR